jgi:predicted P-loop ATPase
VLAMVAQWKGRNRRYGNSVAPLLISSQGYNKSTFCRSLLPDELQWGYTDNLSLDEKRPVLQAMSQMLLVNLDEFNQISPRIQEGFLKNTIQLARVKAKRPYGKHIEDFPRLASFIATTNIADVLADPSGNRRFIGIELTGPINVRVRPNHTQIYAQAQQLIEQGEPYWFDDKETRLIMQHNRQFHTESAAEQCFHEQFKVAEDEKTGMWMTAAAILSSLRVTYGASLLKQTSLVAFGRALSNMEGMHHHHSVDGTQYCVTLK